MKTLLLLSFFLGWACVGALATQPVRIVGTGARIAYTRYTTSTTHTSFWHRTPHKLGGPVAELDVGFMNWLHTTTAEAANTTSVTINQAWIVRASTNQVLPLTFGGQRQLTMPANSTQAYFLADPIPSSLWTGAALARDEVFWVCAKGSLPASGGVCLGTPSTYSGARFILYDPVNEPGSFDIPGTVPSISGQNARTDGLPMVFLGRYTGPGYLAVAGIGDSIMSGTGDTANPVPVIAGYGFFNRAAVDSNGANAIAMMNVSRHGETAGNWTSSHALRQQLLAFANVAVEEYGTNDLGSNGTGNVATLYTRLQGVWANARAAGVQRLLRTRLLPRTTSVSGNFISFADQTPNTGWGAGGVRDQLNALLVTAHSQGLFDTLIDTLSPVADPADDHYWLTNGTIDYATTDGTHLARAGNALIATGVRAALLATRVDDYAAWSAGINWQSNSSTAAADANSDGVSNLMAYALAAPATASAANYLPQATRDPTWLSFTYRKNDHAADLTYTVQTSPDLSTWTDAVPNGTSILSEVAHADPDGDGRCLLLRTRIATTGSGLFVRLVVTQN
ncbi:MAG: SGNH/GDSL hydrolase family protein [Verrucomicrobiaceae bacterium]|nr:SGNH/GDSL hydrolase family protein [Verrucomicrobiaceae bacterium]